VDFINKDQQKRGNDVPPASKKARGNGFEATASPLSVGHGRPCQLLHRCIAGTLHTLCGKWMCGDVGEGACLFFVFL